MFKSYWDFTDKERSQFTEKDVNRLLDAELMINGVMRPEKPPVLLDPKDLDLPKQQFIRVKHGPYGHQVLDIVFNTVKQAEEFVALQPRIVVDDWETKTKYTKIIENPTIFGEQFVNEPDVVAAKVELKRIVAQRGEIERAHAEFVKQSQAVDKVTSQVWDDWHNKRSEHTRMVKIQTTFLEYVQLAGTYDIAISFLIKVFSVEDIRNAAVWLEDKTLANALESHQSLGHAASLTPEARRDDSPSRPEPASGDDITF